jgi:hypothetical protein
MKHLRTAWPLPIVLVGLCCAPVDDRLEEKGATGPVEIPKGIQPRVQSAIENVARRDLRIDHSFWTVFHGILGLGLDAQLVKPSTGERVNAVEYIRQGGEIRGMKFLPTEDGVDVRTGPTFVGQGHQDQFVAEMTQQGLSPDADFLIEGKHHKFMEFVRHAQLRARVTDNQELSWALIVIGQNLGTDVSWMNRAGEKLHFEDLVRYELNESIEGEKVACGGTHRLFGLSWVYHLHRLKGGAKAGVWQQLAEKTAKYQKLAHEYQNKDGSFSTEYFRGRGNARNDQLRISTTGHILEWLALSLSDEELRQPWVQEAVSALSMMILGNRDESIESGALYHAAHGLILYHTRVFGPISGRHVPPCPPPPRD